MSTERKLLIAFGASCVFVFFAAMQAGCLFGIYHRRGATLVCLVIGVLAWWLGSSIADVLRKSPSSPNHRQVPRRDRLAAWATKRCLGHLDRLPNSTEEFYALPNWKAALCCVRFLRACPYGAIVWLMHKPTPSTPKST